jgi:hypothetical protein
MTLGQCLPGPEKFQTKQTPFWFVIFSDAYAVQTSIPNQTLFFKFGIFFLKQTRVEFVSDPNSFPNC